MDATGRIYEELEDQETNPEDRARLDGYLKGRAEIDETVRLKNEVARLSDMVKEYEEQLAQTPKADSSP
jgi:hypothetical protein